MKQLLDRLDLRAACQYVARNLEMGLESSHFLKKGAANGARG
ncbi:hypothetical protein BSS2_I0373 [Brucella suis bv. 1 str. S2]|uniref:Uncharacterized protein n=1 Tax=Brucella suis biovar 1 (strain 1330) TaxID=204722 RepID=A0A0H3GA49_BRUSU|nr:hypothetical protein BR0380 [Brucella suis 1330]AEM17739.1 hypothetical protein BS1330_I0381 [Brucella suis 1330]AEU05407.1 hypothetical protein BSVBI22_A0381 [Brucella suis VBI22]AHN46035.1 hypothetical protein BSS2_I0373 [Brucella suis bv. 1 str. S2]